MAQRRVYELAEELGFNRQELVTKINSLGLGFSVGNYMTALSPIEVDTLKRALKGDKKGQDGATKAAPARKRKVEPKAEEAAAAAPPAVATPVRRRKKADEPDVSASDAEERVALVKPMVRRRKADELEDEAVAEPALAPVEVKVEAKVVQAPEAKPVAEPPAVVAVKPEVVTEAPVESVPVQSEAKAEPKVIDETPIAADADVAAVATGEQPVDADAAQVEGDGAPIADRPPGHPQRPAAPKRGGAKVLGKISETVLLERLAAEGKDFTPGPARAREREATTETAGDASQRVRRSRTKRVVEGRDLYDPKARRTKRRGSRDSGRGDKRGKQQMLDIAQTAEHKKVIRIEDVVSVGDLAHQMGIKAAQVAMKLIESGMMATVNTTLDYDTAAIIAEDFGYTVENVAFDISNFYDTVADAEETLLARPAVVTVMGHVDHGKTSLLDVIRKASVTSGEFGGITQHIGAYTVQTERGETTFLDTPGHEAFTALRARGAKATDIVVLVVAADDGVMPQTVEAINHARDAKVPIVVAINKIDVPAANPERVKTALSEYNLVPEEWGGSTLFVEVSAKANLGVDDLLEAIHLQTEVEELKANPNREAQGLVIEAELDIGRGPVATVLVQRGTLKQGDLIVSGRFYGRVRAMIDDRAKPVSLAGPSCPVVITGLNGIPEAGEPFFVMTDEKAAKRITEHVAGQRRKENMASRSREMHGSLEDLSAMILKGELKELKLILKGDVHGSVEALKDAFAKLGNDEVRVRTIHHGVGGITENDVNLAASSEAGAIIVGFNVRPDNRAADTAEKFNVQILTHNIIYDAIEQVRSILEGLLSPIIEERILGHAEVRDTFHAPKIGTIAGCYVRDGILRRNARARLLRDGRIIYESSLGSLRRFKEDVREVKTGFECGTSMDNYNDIKIGDIIEVYEFEEVTATF
ncbi:MAG: translation initiation factor IF-2 [Bradymonadaceae bacterium]|nr:translation initiation factor IF-2 [Lujinxingiaceae bacterium]